jgi:transposase-like protein
MKCPKCSSNNINAVVYDIEDEINYGCLDCDCWFTVHDETYTKLSEELKCEMTMS